MPETITASTDLWTRGQRVWNSLGPPLRPSAEDVDRYQQIVDQWVDINGAPQSVVLGSTPEFSKLDWPHGTRLTAVDRCPAMLTHVWPGFPEPGCGAVVGEWFDLPLSASSCDLAFADGSTTPLRFPEGHQRLFRSIHRVLRPEGMVCMRCFIRAGYRESPREVWNQLQRGQIDNFHVFKWKLAMSLQQDVRHGVQLDAIWGAWDELRSRYDGACSSAWASELTETIEWYRGMSDRYYFPTLAELREIYLEDFEELDVYFPTYTLGSRCPIITLAQKSCPMIFK